MPRSPLASSLQDLASVASEASRRNMDTEQVITERATHSTSRRDFLKLAAASLAAVAFQPLTRSFAAAPRIAVVGAGLAGLTAAYRLKQAGCSSTVFEAANRVGGRCWTGRGLFHEGQIIEHGGELIDSGHKALRHLANELGLKLDNLLKAEAPGTDALFYFDGRPYTATQAARDIQGIWEKIQSDLSAADYPTQYNLKTERGIQLDHMSIIDWINESVPDGINSKLGQLLDVAYNIEYGAESNVQSSLNLLYLLGFGSGGRQLELYGESDEKFHVNGGNDQIATRLAEALTGQIQLGRELVAIKRNSGGTVTLTMKNGKKLTDHVFDKVVLAIPFSVLRNSVDYTRAGFSALKNTAISELGMGTNSKMQLQFTNRYWESIGQNGATNSDTGYQTTWDVTRAQAGASGILVDYTGGDIGASFGTGRPADRARQFLGQLEPVMPGITPLWNGKVIIDHWQSYKWTLGSYSYWKVGQYTKFSGMEGVREGNCHFAGEHTSVDFQGFLNGAVESGDRAVDEILADLK